MVLFFPVSNYVELNIMWIVGSYDVHVEKCQFGLMFLLIHTKWASFFQCQFMVKNNIMWIKGGYDVHEEKFSSISGTLVL